MCELCSNITKNKDVRLLDKYGCCLIKYEDSVTLETKWNHNPLHFNYCPMCGRNLTMEQTQVRYIVDGLLYDTDKSTFIEMDCTGERLYASPKKRLFATRRQKITNTDQDRLKTYLGTNHPDKYIELFGEVEEA